MNSRLPEYINVPARLGSRIHYAGEGEKVNVRRALTPGIGEIEMVHPGRVKYA